MESQTRAPPPAFMLYYAEIFQVRKKKKAPEDISVNIGVRNTPLKEESIANAIKASFLHDFPPPSAPTTVPSFPTHVFMTRLHLYVSVCF